MSKATILSFFLGAYCTSLVLAAALAQSDVPPLVPWPKRVAMKPGAVALTPQSRIVTTDPALRPMAGILADEMQAAAGVRPAAAEGPAQPGDIVLAIDAALKGEAHTVQIGDGATVRGGNYGAVALGTATLLQAVQVRDGKATLPCLSLDDEPAVEYRGLMVDVARQYHSIASLKQIVQLCRLYKIRYLQLHLTDDQSFMFPSKAYPLLATKNQHGGKTYTIEELKDLVAYADARNVTIVPEYEVPGHSAAANRAMPDLFVIRGTKPYEHHASINFVKDDVMKAVATIVGEMCEVFRSSPYFHIGGDEADLALANQNADFQAAFQKHNLPNQHQLYRKFVVDMNEIVKRHGKQTIVWEGFGHEPKSPIQIPRDIIVMAYEIRFYRPDALVRDGYTVINAAWTPLYVVNAKVRPPEEIYAWHVRQFKPHGAKPEDAGVLVPPDGKVFGAQMCAWEQPEKAELPSLRNRLPAMAERIWNPTAGKDFSDFARRAEATDRLLDRLLQPSQSAAAARQAKVLVLTGNEYPGHPWKETAPLLAKFLAADARLATTVNADPKFLASPKLHDYDAIVLNYMNWQSPDPGEEARANLKKFVESGKGLVLVHFACGAFQGWPEFAKIAGRAWDPKLRGHDPHGKFTVEIAKPDHPVTRGLKPFETIDELYTCLAGDAPIEVLATAKSKVDQKDYPMAFVLRYGKGRVFHCVLGHDARALSGDAVQELYRRGTAWTVGLPPTGLGEAGK